MYRYAKYTETMKDEWDDLASTHGTIFHSIAFREILTSSFGYQSAYHVILDKDDHICAIIPLIVGHNLMLQNVGVSLPFINYMDICAENKEALHFAMISILALKDEYHLAYIELRLKEQRPSSAVWDVQLANHTFVLPLLDTEQQVLALATSSCRNHVRKVYKNNWFSVSFDTNHLDDWYQVYVKRMKELGSPAPDIEFFKGFFKYLPEHTFLLTVHDQQTDKVIGGMLLLTSLANETLYYPYGANLVAYNNKYLNNFMYWEAVKFGLQRGMKYLDLGRSQIDSGTYKYKEQWGAKAEQLMYLVYHGGEKGAGPPDRKKLSILVGMWKRTPDFITRQIGRRLIKYLMP